MSMLVAGALCASGGSAALGAAQVAGRFAASVDVCHPAPDLAARYATFGAQMTAVPGTDQMSIRFELDERTPPGADFHPVTGVPGFGVWKSSASGVDIFGFSQEVSSLSSNAAFRVTVSYRWLGPRHRVIKRARRTSPACSLPVSAANLVVGTLSRQPKAPAAAGGIVGSLCAASTSAPDPAGSASTERDTPTVVCP